MKKLIRSALLLPVMALALQACGPKFKDQPSCGFVQNVYGERISWKGNVPVDMYVHQSVPPSMYQSLERAARTWEDRAGRPLFRFHYNTPGAIAPRQDGANVIYWMSNWEDKKASEQARTSVYWVGDEIRETDIRINAKNFTFFTESANQASYAAVDMESLMLHELGHVLGLKHKDDGGSVMATYLASQTERRNVSIEDEQNLQCEY